MADYTKSTGSTGSMMIRDTGSVIEFWLKVGSQTWSGRMPWRYTANGSTTAWKYIDFRGTGSYQKLGSVTVTTSQTVSFYIGDTGTLGLAGPTTLSVSISRGSKPPAPTAPRISSITNTSVFADSDSNGDGGLSVTRWQIGYGKSSSSPGAYIDAGLSNGQATITELVPGSTYYFWARGLNSLGWSAWSTRSSAKTHSDPSAPSRPSLSNITTTSVTVTFKDGANGGSSITKRWIGYGATSATTTVESDGSTTLTGLSPGTNYRIWARTENKYGQGPWSPYASMVSDHTASVFYDGQWQNAVAFVKVNGVWKPAKPMVKIAGMWKGTG